MRKHTNQCTATNSTDNRTTGERAPPITANLQPVIAAIWQVFSNIQSMHDHPDLGGWFTPSPSLCCWITFPITATFSTTNAHPNKKHQEPQPEKEAWEAGGSAKRSQRPRVPAGPNRKEGGGAASVLCKASWRDPHDGSHSQILYTASPAHRSSMPTVTPIPNSVTAEAPLHAHSWWLTQMPDTKSRHPHQARHKPATLSHRHGPARAHQSLREQWTRCPHLDGSQHLDPASGPGPVQPRSCSQPPTQT